MCRQCREDHKFLFMMILLVLALCIAVTAVSGRYLEYRINQLDQRVPVTQPARP